MPFLGYNIRHIFSAIIIFLGNIYWNKLQDFPE